MSFLSSLNISGSGLTAQKMRMDVIAQNIANAQVTRTESGGPYRRKMVVLSSIDGGSNSFKDVMERVTRLKGAKTEGVKVSQIIQDSAELTPVYNPTHPDANDEGYVMMPNVNTAQEMIDLMAASRAYESNVTVLNATKDMALKALEIGR